MCLKKNCSYVGKNESLWIKGLLTFLIVLGHNMVFTLPLSKWGVMSYLYTFHVHCFFLLPFLYGSSPLSKSLLLKQAIRLYWPYIIITTIMMIVYNIFTHFEYFSLINLFKLYTCCGIDSLRTMCGYSALWFLPVMFAVLVLKDIYYYGSRNVKLLLIVLGILLHLYNLAKYSSLSLPSLPDYLFVFATSIRYLFMGVCCRKLMDITINTKSFIMVILFVSLFLIGTIIYVIQVATRIINGVNIWFVFLQIWMPIVFMLLLCKSLDLVKVKSSSFIVKTGAYSLPIYIISPFIGYIMYFLILRLDLIYWWIGLIVQVIIFGVSYVLSAYCLKHKIARFLFPKNIDDIKKSFNK